MGLFEKVKMGWDPLAAVKKLIESWRPRGCDTEKDFEESLTKHLEKNLPGIEIVKQFGTGRLRGDIVVDKRVLIEIKKDLNSTAKLQRLIGKIELYEREWKKPVIIVLVAEKDKNLVGELRKRAKKYTEDSIFLLPMGDTCLIMEK